jgi:hypothetical protein
MSNQTNLISEDSINFEIQKFLNILNNNVNVDYKKCKFYYMSLINGGTINNVKIDGFIKLKNKILLYIKQKPDQSSIALSFIKNCENHFKFYK